MDTNILFKIDGTTKEKARLKAKKQGLTLSAFLRSVTRAYVDGNLDVGIEVSTETKRAIRKGLRDVRGKKTSDAEHVFKKFNL